MFNVLNLYNNFLKNRKNIWHPASKTWLIGYYIKVSLCTFFPLKD